MKIYTIVSGSFCRDNIVQDVYEHKSDAIKDILHRQKQYNEIVDEINSLSLNNIRKRIEVGNDSKNRYSNEIYRLESDLDFIVLLEEIIY
jgi:hypothetical protein